jgi:signal transduction histidine kinase/CheY-like chemotaxis protein
VIARTNEAETSMAETSTAETSMPKASQVMGEDVADSERVIFLSPNPQDTRTARKVFAEVDVEMASCDCLQDVVAQAREGTGALVIAAERLVVAEVDDLATYLRSQPVWSDLPVLVVTRAGKSGAAARGLSDVANITLLDRPVRFRTLVSSVNAALRDRRRQYELRRSIANRDRFLAMLGHELRNPLAAIIMGLEQVRAGATEVPLEMLRRQSNNLERIVDDLLDVSRISRGVISFDMNRVDLAIIARQAAKAFEDVAVSHDLELRIDVPDDEPLWVDGDSVRLEQCLGNLLSNAVRYTPEGGCIDVSARCRDDQAIVAVRDTGIGIPDEMIEHIFGLFAQAHSDVSRREGGLGLGLSLVQSIVEEHGGEVRTRSEGADKGSVFEVSLPVCDPPRSSSPDRMEPDRLETDSFEPDRSSPDRSSPDHSDDETSPPEPKLELLLVEDVADVRAPLRDMLRLRGYAVDEAACGLDAVSCAEAGDYDAILLDIGLPDIDGFEVARRIRADGYEGGIVALTGYGGSEDREEARRAGMDLLLTKPVDLAELEDALPSNTP